MCGRLKCFSRYALLMTWHLEVACPHKRVAIVVEGGLEILLVEVVVEVVCPAHRRDDGRVGPIVANQLLSKLLVYGRLTMFSSNMSFKSVKLDDTSTDAVNVPSSPPPIT